jgi:hypothetical protein
MWGQSKRNSLSGKKLPLTGVIPFENPAHNGEALPSGLDQGRDNGWRVMPWEALCRAVQHGMAP